MCSSDLRRAAVSSFGFGGSNFHCVLEEAAKAEESGTPEISNQIIAFSGVDQDAFLTQLEGVPETSKWSEVRAFAARSRSSFDASAPCRLFLVFSNDSGSLAKTLSSAKRILSSHPDRNRWSTPEGAIFGRTGTVGKLGVLFPGQGSQYVGMMRDLACQFPQFQKVFDDANRAFIDDRPKSLPDRLSDYIYPHPAFDQETLDRQEQVLVETLYGAGGAGPVALDYANIASAVFSQPPIGTVGLSEHGARGIAKAGIDVFVSNFTPMKHTLSGRDEKTMMKLVVDRETDRVLGCHMVGLDAPEIIQGVAIAIKCGATKAQFDATIGIHPTAAEEFVTLSEKRTQA